MTTMFFKNKGFPFSAGIIAILCFLMLPLQLDAQRMPRGGSRGGASRPAPSRQAPRSNSTTRTKPATQQSRPSTQNKSRPQSKPQGTINGGSKKNVDRSEAKNKGSQAAANRGGTGDRNVDKQNIKDNRVGNETNVGNKTNIGNKTEINTGDRNVNINVDNSRDVNVNRSSYYRPSPYAYRRPPYSYGGFHFSCHFGYSYHPYQPYYYGPSYHPWGFFVATLAATAIIVSVNNQQYQYDQGVFYEESDGGYTAVEAPNGAVVSDIPKDAEQVTIEQNVTNNYYYGGTYYELSDGVYTVVPPTAGSLVETLPEGAEEVKMGDVTYVKYGETYYQPVSVDGKDMYEVVQIEPAEGD